MSNLVTGYKRPDGTDIGDALIDKSYLIDRYPELLDQLKQAGLWTWGINTNGRLGDNSITTRSSPVQTIASGANWRQVASKVNHAAAIKSDGTLWTWGLGDEGQLGDNTATTKSSPVQTVAGGTNWKQVAVGVNHTAAIKTDGTLWTWGANTLGGLGDNSTTPRSSPVQTVSGGTNWKQVDCGSGLTAAIKTDGTLWAWGQNSGGIGDDTIAAKSSPVQTIAAGTNWKLVACGRNTIITGAIKTDGTLWLWGTGTSGQLGDNTVTTKSSPVQTVAGGTNWKIISFGSTHSAAIKTDGTLWLWGAGISGQLGANNRTAYSSPVQTVSGGTNWYSVAGGGENTAALKTDGSLWTWGKNSGALGNNASGDRSSPVQTVAGGTNWKQLSGGTDHFFCIRDDSVDPI